MAILTLAIGLGATTALFSVANAWLLTPLPFHEPHRLTMAWETIPSAGIEQNTPAPAIVKLWRERSQTFEGFAPWTLITLKMTGGPEPLQIDGARVSREVLPLLGIGPLLGRNFTADEDRAGGAITALLSEPFWTRTFGRDASIVGRTIQLDGRPVEVIGVLPSSVRLVGLNADLWLPLALTAQEQESFNRILWVMGRLRPGVTPDQGLRDLDSLMREQSNGSLGANVIDLREQTVGTLERDVRLLLLATFCVLLIACANVASLTVARIIGRRNELVVRTALGASRLRLARQVLVEIVALGVVAGIAGVLIAGWLVRAVVALVREAEQLSHVEIANGPVLAFALLAALAAAALCAVVPAWQAGGVDLATSLREQTRSSTATKRWLLNGFVIVEVAVALALLVSAGLVLRSFHNIGNVNLGFRPNHLIAFQVPREGGETAAAGRAFYDQLLRELEQVPGIRAAGLTQSLPIRSSAMGAGFQIEGRQGDGSSVLAYWRTVSASYFEAMEMPMITGRAFTAADRTGAPDVAIVSESFARRAWPDGSAIGKRIGWGTLDHPLTVVGVVGDVRVSPASPPRPHVYMPFMQVGARLPGDLVVRARGSVASAVAAVRRTVWAIDPTQPVAGVMTMDQLLWNAAGRRRFQLTLVSLFAGVAALLALIGIYSVLSYVVGQSIKEIGIRLALGASPSRVRWLVLRQGLTVLAIGAWAGLLLAMWSGQLVRAFLFNLDPIDPLTYVLAVTGLLLAGAVACGLPALRAARVDPIVTLRAE
jgi:predicted permease